MKIPHKEKKPKSPYQRQTSLSISLATHAKLKLLSKKSGQSISSIISMLVENARA